jgi:hypothetical protein
MRTATAFIERSADCPISERRKQAYTERVDPNKLSNLQLSRLLIFIAL